MYELLKLLLAVQKDKLLYKSIEFKDGFAYALNFIKLHGVETKYFHELSDIKKELAEVTEKYNTSHKNHKDICEDLRKRLVESNAKNSRLERKLTKAEAHDTARKEKDRHYGQRKGLTAILSNEKTNNETKVKAALEYLEQIKKGLEE